MRVQDRFDISYGHSLALNSLKQVDVGEGIAFVSRTSKNNGVSAWVEPIDGLEPLPAGLLTVCLRSRNHALSTFVQPRPFYCGYHIFVLSPKQCMTIQEKLWWATCIRENRYRYNFGRQANRSLPDLSLPKEIPSWVNDSKIPLLGQQALKSSDSSIDTGSWVSHPLSSLFELRRGRNILKREMNEGTTAYIGASASNNGVTAWIDANPDYNGGQITVSSNGSVGEAFYQPNPFIASGDVTVLSPLYPFDTASALFICTLLRAEKHKWNYGRKWGIARMRETEIRIPVTEMGLPDWERMRDIVEGAPLFELVRRDITEDA